MRGCLPTTDRDWFDFLSKQSGLEEANFWQPSGSRGFSLDPGSPVFFKLKAPVTKIAGFGSLSRHTVLPHRLAKA